MMWAFLETKGSWKALKGLEQPLNCVSEVTRYNFFPQRKWSYLCQLSWANMSAHLFGLFFPALSSKCMTTHLLFHQFIMEGDICFWPSVKSVKLVILTFSSTGGAHQFFSVEKMEILSLSCLDLDLKSTVVKGTWLGWCVRSDTSQSEDSQKARKSLMGEYQMCLWRLPQLSE